MKAMSDDYLIFERLLGKHLSLLKRDGAIGLVQIFWVNARDMAAIVDNLLFWPHKFINKHMTMVIDDSKACKCALFTSLLPCDTDHFTVKGHNNCLTAGHFIRWIENFISDCTWCY